MVTINNENDGNAHIVSLLSNKQLWADDDGA